LVLNTENGLGLGLNLKRSVASLGLNFSKFVTAGTVGTLSLASVANGRALGELPNPVLNLVLVTGTCCCCCLGTNWNCCSEVTDPPCGNRVCLKSC